MKWGTKFTADYVNILYSMVGKNLPEPFRFVCMTDDSTGIREEVECLPCPELPVEHRKKNFGWRKITLWAKQLPQMEGQWLFLDLDVVILDSIVDFFQWEPDTTFLVMKNSTEPKKKIGNTSVFRFEVGSHPHLYEYLIRDPNRYMDLYRNSQTYVSKEIDGIHFWPDEWCRLFKVHCVPPLPSRWWKTPLKPVGAKIVAFPGVPNPPEARDGLWPAKWYKRFYKTIKPTPWISEYWKDDGTS